MAFICLIVLLVFVSDLKQENHWLPIENLLRLQQAYEYHGHPLVGLV